MASNEDILMQFKAIDDVSNVVKTMESNVLSSMESMKSASSNMDAGLNNLTKTSKNISKSFDNFKNKDIDVDVDLNIANAEKELEELNIKSKELGEQLTHMQLYGGKPVHGEEIDKLEKQLAQIDKRKLELYAEIDDAKLQKTKQEVEDIDNAKVSPKIDVDDKEIEKTKEDVDKLDDTKPKIPIKVDGEEEFDEVKQKIDDIDNGEIDVNVNNIAAMAAVDQIGEGFDRLKQGAGELGEQMGSLLNSAGKQETNKAFLEQAVGDADVAKQKLEDINGVVQALPGDDSVLQGLLGQAVAKDASLTTDELTKMGGAAADYFAAMENFGKNSTEAFQDMNNYLMTGMTAEIERSPILANHIDKLKEANTIQERSKLLQEALNEEHWGGISQQDTYNNKLQTFEGMLERGRYNLGGLFQESAKGGMEFVMQLDDATGGLVGMGIALAGMASPLTDTIMGLGQIATGIKSIQDLGFVDFLKDVASAKKAGDTASAVGSVGDVVDDIPSMNTGGIAKGSTEVVKDASTVSALAPEAEAAAAGTTATGGAMSGIATAFTSMIVPLLAISAVVAVMIPIIAGLVAEALIFIKGIQLLIDALDFDSIDLTGAIEGIKQVGQAMLEIGIAMGEMTFANVMTGLAVFTSGVTGLINPIQVAGQMLVQAANELQVFNTVNIDPSIPANIKSISNALKLVADSMGSLTNVVMSMALGNIMTLGGLLGNVSTAITTAKNEITHAANEIATLKTLPDIDQGAVDKLKKVSDSLSSVAEAMEALRSLRDAQNWDNLFSRISDLFGGVDIQSALYGIRDDLYKASASLAIFKDMSNVPQGVGTKLKAVADALKSVSESIESLRKLRDDYNWDSSWGNIFQGTDIPGAINAIRADLFKVSASLRTLNDMSAIPEGTGQKIQRVAWTTNNVISAVNSLKNLNSQVDGNVDLTNVVSNIDKANSTLRQVASRLRSLSTIANIPEGLGTKIRNITNTTNQLKGSISAMNGIPQTNEGTSQRVQKAVDSVRKVATQLNRLQDTSVSGGIGQVLSSVSNAVNQLKTTLNSSAGGFKSAGTSIGSNIKSGISQSLAGLNSIVVTRVNSATGSGASTAWTGGARMGNSATRGFQSAFKIADIASAELREAITALQNGSGDFYQVVREIASNAVTEAENASGHHSPGYIAQMWGAEMDESSLMIKNHGAGVIDSVRNMTRGVVNAGQGSINMGSAFTTDGFNYNRLNSVNAMNKPSDMGKQQRPVNITIGAGAIQLDARNLTTKESRQIMINALEGLEVVNGIDINGV